MAIAAHAAMQQRYDFLQIRWLVSPRNPSLTAALDKANLEYSTLSRVHPFSLWRNPFRSVWMICNNAVRLRRLMPDLVVIVQGGILLSFGGILSAKIGMMRCCSYIPTVHPISDVRKCKFPVLADFFWSHLYRGISSYITIDAEQAKRLRRENSDASVIVVENYVPEFDHPDSESGSRAMLGLPSERKILAVVGRIEFANKSQDWILRSLRDSPFLADKFVLFVGDGPDACALQAMVVPEISDRFGLIGWTNNLREVYSATDVLLIPSKVEGVPLVMLEALSCRIPVVGTNRGGMVSWLPEEWRFNWGDTDGLKRAIGQALTASLPDAWDRIAERLLQTHDEDRFAAQFSQALIHYCQQ